MNPTNTGPGRPSDDTVKTKTATEADIAANESLKRNPTLCHYCRNICDNWPAAEFESPSFEHYGTEKELLDSAEAGCGICAQACADESYSQLFKLVNGSWVLQYGVLISMPAPSAQNHTTGIVSLSSHGPDCYDIRIFTPNIDLVESHLLEHRFQYRKVRLSAYGNGKSSQSSRFNGLLSFVLCICHLHRCSIHTRKSPPSKLLSVNKGWPPISQILAGQLRHYPSMPQYIGTLFHPDTTCRSHERQG